MNTAHNRTPGTPLSRRVTSNRPFIPTLAAILMLGVTGSHVLAMERDPFIDAVPVAENMEPARQHPAQQAQAEARLQALEARTGQKPNILILLVDDMGWGDPGAFGGGLAVGAPTPNIDRLAQEGLKLTSTYSQPTCTPTRAALMTGRLPARTGLTRPTLTGESTAVNPWSSEQTAAGLLSDVGYMTALSGKWHLGSGEGSQPHQVGYDEYFGILSVVSEFTQGLDEQRYPELVHNPERMAALRELSTPAVTAASKGGTLEVIAELDSIADVAEIDQQFAAFSEDFIERAAQADKPFYLVHSFSRVHNDNFPARDFVGASPAATPYKDAVVEVDDIVGRLVRKLEEQGIADNTLVFFTSDNGANEDAWPDAGFQPWRGGKGTTWEGGVRVPGIAWWPGMIAGGRTNEGLFDLLDLFNTSLTLGGAELPDDRYIDGVDQTSFLLADNGDSHREAVFMYSERNLTAIRWEEFKVHFKVFQTHVPGSNLDESTLVSTGMSPWVYNLYLDPKEQKSVGHRTFEWGLPRILRLVDQHIGTYQRYPMKEIGLTKPF
ncbi:arylsulfatase [Marinobacter mobilis]|uniref:Arylsulfatase n=1 Tax=Marinobacter mobilis TaxID=488533 RepID=A0A1H2XXH2_9GAMM|nr:arylsulfatase [Marinobacter mobilis]SDW97104.1 arylsulfatase [Marinobacter mobilis]